MTDSAVATQGPIIQDVASTSFKTSMFSTAQFELGEPMDTLPSPVNPGPPFLVVVDLPAGVSNTNSHYHPDYSFLMWPTGGYEIAGVFYPADTVMLTEPGARTGECAPAPEGSTEVAFYPSAWGGLPFFIDLDDPRGVGMTEELGERGRALSQITPPGPIDGASFKLLDREKHAVRADGFTAYPCQLGPSGFGTIPTSDDPRSYAILVEFDAGVELPVHRHDGWVALTVIDGALEIEGEHRGKEVIIAYPAGTPMSIKVADKPTRVIFYIEHGKAAIPIFDDANVAGADGVRAVFGRA